MGASPGSSSNASPLMRPAAAIKSSITASSRAIRSAGQLQDAAVGEAGDHLAIDDPGRRDATTLAQPQQDRQQWMARAVNLDAEVEREFSAWRIGDPHVALPDRSNQARTERAVDLVLPAERLQCRKALGDKALPGFRGVAATKGKYHAALRCLAGSHPHLHKAVTTDGVNHGSLPRPVAAREDRPAGIVDSDELPIIVEWDDRAAVIEFHQQGIERSHPAELVWAGEARQPQHGRERPIDDHLLAGRRRLNPPPRQDHWRARRRARCHDRRLHSDTPYCAGGDIDVPRSGRTDDQPGTGRQGCRRRGGEYPNLAMHETPAPSMPSSLPALHECPQHVVDPRRRNASPRFIAVAQQARDLADCPIGTFSGGYPAWRGRDGSAGTLPDEERGNNTSIRRHAGGEFEYRPLPLLLRRGRQ